MCTPFTELQSATDEWEYCRKLFDHLGDARAGEGEGLLREEDKSQILWCADPTWGSCAMLVMDDCGLDHHWWLF